MDGLDVEEIQLANLENAFTLGAEYYGKVYVRTAETIKKLNAKNYMNVFNRQNLCFISGEANVLTDIYGKKYVDFVSGLGVNTLGYNHPKLTQAVCDQAI